MDLYFLNFKRILVILNGKEMRLELLSMFEEKKIDVNIKFVDSYLAAASLIQETQHDPYNHVVLNLSYSNNKLNDFIEFIKPMLEKDPNFLIEYSQEIGLSFVDL